VPYVTELKLNNFYNYSSEVHYKFKEGINIVVADNNGGKSKLYNAFLWILRDEVFDSDSRKYTSLISPKNQFKIISDKAKYETSIGDTITTSVTLIFKNDFAAKKSGLGVAKYKVTKTIKAKKVKNGSPFSYENWSVSLKKPEYIRTRGYKTKPITDSNTQNDIIKFLLPHALQEYYMFQGEEISQLVGKKLTNAISKITGIKKFDFFENYLVDIVTKAKSALDKEKKKVAKNSEDATRLSLDIERSESIVMEHKEHIKSLKKNYETIEERYSSLHEQYMEASNQSAIIREVSQIEEKINRNRDELEKIEQNYNNNFFEKKWLLYGIDKCVKNFINSRTKYTENKSKKSTESFISSLPYNIPDVPSLDQMIKNMHCYVCDRPISKDGDAWEHLQKLRDRNNNKGKKVHKISRVSAFIDELFQHSGNIPNEDEIKQTDQDGKERIISLNKKLDDLTELKNDLEEKQNQEEKTVLKIVNDYKECGNLKERIALDRQRHEGLEEDAKKMLKKHQSQFNKLAGVDEINQGYQKKLDILEDLLEAFYEAKKQHYDEQAMALSLAANEDYKKLTRGNQTAPGSIEIKVSSDFQFNSQLKNPEGGILSGQGTAFQRMKQLSLLLGIVKLGHNTDYPLIADAPVSELSPILTKNFFNTIPIKFKQSILLVKDLIDDSSQSKDNISLNFLGNEIKDDKYLDPKIYINNARGKDQHHRETEILLIKE
jgi:DNA sulfur modification protein DndD